MKFHILRPVMIILLLAITGFWIWVSSRDLDKQLKYQATFPAVGFSAPDFELTALDGNRIKLSELKGQAVIINFWASWCPPCRSEMPAIQKLFLDNSPDSLTILAINMTNIDSDTAAYKFILENQLTFPVLFDRDGTISQLYQANSLPTTFFIDHNGIINDIVIGGPISEALLRIKLDELVISME